MARPTNGTVLSDRYELSEQLGAGGMAEVYLGRDRVLGRTVAVKTLHTQYAGDQHFIERFRREAQSAAALNHPNIVGVYDTGADDGAHYIVMEYVEGRTLRDAIREEGPLLPERATELASEVCEGLAYAHSRGIIHRDVKPANIMLTPNGVVKVADFGIARAISGDTVTQTAMVLGTAQYFSPEQAQSQPVDARSDIYSLGVCLYEMLTRQVPFTGSSPVAIAYKHVKEDPMVPSRLNPDIPPELEAIVMKALAKNPNNRYQSADEMREDLVRALHGRPVQATPVLTDMTGVMSPIADETVVIERGPRGGVTEYRTVARSEEDKRRRTGIILLSVIVAAILGLAAWALIGLLTEAQVKTVPNVVGETAATAQSRLEATGFKVTFAPETVFDDEIPANSVAKQDPLEGTKLEEGKTITLTLSAGRQLVDVPNVVGKNLGEAQDILEDAGFKVRVIDNRTDPEVPAGRVISQDPTSAGAAKKGSTVNLIVSEGPPTTLVPNVVGQSQEDAEIELRNEGFTVSLRREVSGPDCDQPPGFVCRQSPESGQRVQQGSNVTIWVATEPAPSPTPTETQQPQCSDSLDNDADGDADFPQDEQCTDPSDNDEAA